MKVDILQHDLVPKHDILSDEEAEQVLNDLKITKDQLPKVLPEDPVVKAIGAKTDDVLKITRKSETAGIFVAYRVVKE